MSKMLKVNDKVSWRGGFGNDPAKVAIIEGIEINCKGGKEGEDVDEVEWNKVSRENVVVNLSTGCWAYGNQISPL